ncbi:MAG: DNA polymerase III subunit alpha [Lentisphaeria bacterium]
MSAAFVHLHVHTDYSMLDGACRVKDLVKAAAKCGMPALAVTDHGNMCAALALYKACDDLKKSGTVVKPIVGCEFYVAPGDHRDRTPGPNASGFHLVLLAENNDGYANLCRLNSAAWLEGYYYKARVDLALLRQYRAGLICLTACIGGEVPYKLLHHGVDPARQALRELHDIFGADHLFVELQSHGIADEAKAAPGLVELAREFGLGLVATNDSHYLRKEDAAAHEVLLCIGTQATLDDPKHMKFDGPEFYLKTPEEMEQLFGHLPEALANTVSIAERCNVSFNFKALHYPVYPCPPEFANREAYLRQLCVDGMKERYGFDVAAPELTTEQQEKIARMDYELGIIAKMGFTSYYLVVWDFLHYARRQGIPVGPGRGSGAGSMAAYLTHITDIDPIRYNLLFERFLNPDRVSPPDFDIDLCERRRGEVIEYVRGKYGADCVAQIGTFGTLKAKAVLKDVARAVGRPFADGNLLTKFIPADPKMTLDKALKGYHDKDANKDVPPIKEFVDFIEANPWAQQIIAYCGVIEGLNRNMSIHAAGVIIGDQRLDNLVPLCRGANEEVITQYPAKDCEDLGLLKMDFLGLKTLTIIDDAVKLIAATTGQQVDMDTLPLDDRKTFDLLSRGDTVGVFQLESGGFQPVCRQMGVERIEDVCALVAIYRPGPMQFIPEYCDRKFGRMKIEYDHPVMEPLLKETYGIMLYQEQVMQVVQKVAGFSLAQADNLRRAMGKKKLDEMQKMHALFVEGCGKNGITPERAGDIWEKIVKFAGYGFNKSHSAAYAFLAYRTAWLKANYPVQFMAAMLTSELGNADKLSFYLQATRDMGIEVKQPDVNVSGRTFSVDGACIRFGLAAIKGVGESAADAVTAARQEGGAFKDFDDFCERAGAKLNRRVVECLCKAGAFDGFGRRRAQLFAVLEETLTRAAQTAADRSRGQGSLFDFGLTAGDGTGAAGLRPPLPDLPEWPERERLAYEKALLGVYVTGNPLSEVASVLKTFQSCQIDQLPEVLQANQGGVSVRLGGLINSVDAKRSKKDNRPWAILSLEGLSGSLECLVFADAFEKCGAAIKQDEIVFVEGMADRKDGDNEEEGHVTVTLRADTVVTVRDAPGKLAEEVQLRIRQQRATAETVARLLQLCAAHPGPTPLLLSVICDNGDIAFLRPGTLRIQHSQELRGELLALLGDGGVVEKASKPAQRAPRNGRNGDGRPRWNHAPAEGG